jgi:dTDP-4-amino-4,6-dideoxygalactose transaminase
LGNGTIALQIALKALDIKGEVITTPFSYVATTSSIVWEGCTPLFVDIDENTLNIDPNKIEKSITPKTTAILATHCFGNACDIEAIDTIAKKHDLKVIYDAAHCFGTMYKGKSIFSFGDVSTSSFHATKLYHTIEGGAVFTSSSEILKIMAYMRNFGHDGPESFHGIGINGKNSEFHAAMGLVNLNYIESILKKREEQCDRYDTKLKNLVKIRPKIQKDCTFNYAYYPIILESETILLKIKEALQRKEIFTRRYFYPSLSHLPYVGKSSTPISDDISKKILCLPLYDSLSEEEQDMICRIILRTQNYN